MVGRFNGKMGSSVEKRPRMTKDERRQKYTEIARNRRAKQQDQHRKKDAICYHCRKAGHFFADCPARNETAETLICYKCGSTEHGLASCPSRNDGNPTDLPYATCFLCKAKGHLISQCPLNSKGLFVNGGECRHCGSKHHVASKCPEKAKKSKHETRDPTGNENIEDLLERDEPRQQTKVVKKEKTNDSKAMPTKKRKVVKF